MVDPDEKRAVLLFKERGKGTRWIAKAVGLARSTVQTILKEDLKPGEPASRSRKLTPQLDRIRTLYTKCDRNISRVAEELEAEMMQPIAYSTLTDFCRHHEFGKPRTPEPAGRYDFGLSEEQQHDTSPVWLTVGGVERKYQAASMKLAYSKNRYLRFYRRFRKFECHDFHVRAGEFFCGMCGREMVDNTSVIIAHGTGKDAIPTPEMAAFAARYRFEIKAHEKGDANRSARVERDFSFIQTNFPKGRTFADDDDLNRQAEEWCRKKNMMFHRKLRVFLNRLFEEEKPHLRALPAFRPPACQWYHKRRVDVEGLVVLDGNSYSAPNEYVGKTVSIKETIDTITLMDGARELCVHKRIPEGERRESRLPGHGRLAVRRQRGLQAPSTEEAWIAERSSVLADYVKGLKRLGSRRFPGQLRKLCLLCREYEIAEVETGVARATAYQLFDVTRLEGILLQEYGARLFGKRVGIVDSPGTEPAPAGAGAKTAADTEDDTDTEQEPDAPGGEDDGNA